MATRKPDKVGGGIVFFVSDKTHNFIANIEELEEAGTPGVIQYIRAGICFDLNETVSVKSIRKLEHYHFEILYKRLLKMENLVLLGNNLLPKVNIFSFLIRSRFGKILHPNFVTSLLNDLFGI